MASAVSEWLDSLQDLLKSFFIKREILPISEGISS